MGSLLFEISQNAKSDKTNLKTSQPLTYIDLEDCRTLIWGPESTLVET